MWLNSFGSLPVLRLAGDMSLAAWVRPVATATNRWVMAHAQFGSDSSGDYWLKTDDTNSAKWNGMVYTGSAFQKATSISSPIVNGTWVRLLWTLSGTTLQLYTNGIADGSLTIVGSRTSNTKTNWIGGSTTGSSCLSAAIADPSIWGRALSAGEVNLDYQMSKSNYPPGGPLRYYPSGFAPARHCQPRRAG
jgi:hypothetical protein